MGVLGRGILLVLFGALILSIVTGLFMLLWTYGIASYFGWHSITFVQALCMCLLPAFMAANSARSSR